MCVYSRLLCYEPKSICKQLIINILKPFLKESNFICLTAFEKKSYICQKRIIFSYKKAVFVKNI